MATCSASVHGYSRIQITFVLAIAAAGRLGAGQPYVRAIERIVGWVNEPANDDDSRNNVDPAR